MKEKSKNLKNLLGPLSVNERYDSLIQMGKTLKNYPENLKTPDRIVPGCQSILYLNGELVDGRVLFSAYADALISAGLAALLIALYSEETPETILTVPPNVIQDLGIASSLSLNRSNGFAHIHLKMKQIALEFLTNKSISNNK